MAGSTWRYVRAQGRGRTAGLKNSTETPIDLHLSSSQLHLGVSKNSGFSPQIIHLNRVFHYFRHPFWGTTILGNPWGKPLSIFKLGTSSALQCRFRCLSSCALGLKQSLGENFVPRRSRKLLHSWRLTWNIIPWRFGRSFSFLNGWWL